MDESLLMLNEILIFNIDEEKRKSRDFLLVKNNNLNKNFLINVKLTNRERYIVKPIAKIVRPFETVRIEISLILKENEKIEEINTKKDIFVLLSLLTDKKNIDIDKKDIIDIIEGSDSVKKKYYRVKVNKIERKKKKINKDKSFETNQKKFPDNTISSKKSYYEGIKNFENENYSSKNESLNNSCHLRSTLKLTLTSKKNNKSKNNNLSISDIKNEIIKETEEVFFLNKIIKQLHLQLQKGPKKKIKENNHNYQFWTVLFVLFLGIIIGSLLNS